MKKRVVIVGAGMGGLSAAVALSGRPQLEVTLLEAAPQSGGKVGFHEYDGVRFDTGPSLLTLPGVLTSLMEEKGRRLQEELTLFRPEPVFRYDFPGGEGFDVGSSPEDTEANIRRELGEKAASEFDEFLGYTKKIWEAASPHFVMGGAPTALTAVKLGLTAMKAFRNIDSMSTMVQAIDRRITDRRLRSVFLRYATFNGSDPRRAPATLNCISWVDLGIGGWGVEGGMYEIAKGLQRVAQEGGVECCFHRAITSIERRDNGYRVSWGDGAMDADAVVVNADVRHFIEDLWQEKSDHGVSVDEPLSTSGFNAVIRARRRPAEERAAHAVVFPERDYMEEFVDLFDRRIPPSKPAIYLCAKEKAHRASGWADHEPLFVMANAPAIDETGSSTNWVDFEEKVMLRLREKGHIDDDDQVIWRRTPQGLADAFPGSRGSLYGSASNSRFAAFKRPPNRAPGVPGLYLASGSAHPGGGVPLCIQSGRQAAAELLKDL